MKNLFIIILLSIPVLVFSNAYFESKNTIIGQQYMIDGNVNVRESADIKSKVIGKLQKGDAVKAIEKSDISIISDNIKDYFYKVETKIGIGYVFGGYISDLSDKVLFIGKNYIFFSKQQDIEILLPEKIEQDIFYKNWRNIDSEKDKELIESWYHLSNDRNYFENTYLIEDLSVARKLDALMSKYYKSTIKDKKVSFSQSLLFAKDENNIVEEIIVATKIKEIKIYKNLFTNTTFVGCKLVQFGEGSVDDVETLYVIEDKKFVEKRRLATYAQSGIYQATHKFIFPNEKEGKKDRIIIQGTYFTGNDITEKYYTEIIWNGKEFIEK